MNLNEIKVKSSDFNYSIFIGNKILNTLPKKIRSLCPKTKKIAIILDKKVPKKYKTKIKKLLKNYQLFIFEYSANEKLKSFSNANKLTEKILSKNFNRSDTLIAVGGGIIGDFSAFVASIVKRGINFINIPTTLLAQVDSSIGGKTGVNSKTGKNLIGSFYQPKLVISEISFLQSLSKREFICGFGEVLKYALIRDKKFFKFIKKYSEIILKGQDLKVLTNVVVRSSKNKIYFVISDEKESGKRMILNFGHTFAHGIEAANKFSKKINHGEAVLIGMLLATKLSFVKRLCSKNTIIEIEKIYNKNRLPSNLLRYFKKTELNNIVKFMVNDKKNNDNKINLILLKKIGKTTNPGKIKMSVDQVNNFMKKIS